MYRENQPTNVIPSATVYPTSGTNFTKDIIYLSGYASPPWPTSIQYCTHGQVVEGSLGGQAFQGVRDASIAPILVDEEDALGGALLPAGIVLVKTDKQGGRHEKAA